MSSKTVQFSPTANHPAITVDFVKGPIVNPIVGGPPVGPVVPKFILQFDTTVAGDTPSNQFSLDLFTGETYNFDWETDDAQSGTHVTDSDLVLTFGVSGVHTISITGTLPRLFYNASAEGDKITDLQKWGDIAWTNFQDAFNGCTNMEITATDVPDLSGVTSLRRMFRFCSDITTVPNANLWNTSTIDDMNEVFRGTGLTSIDVSTWNTSIVTDMAHMFRATFLTTLDLSLWDTGLVTNMSRMFLSVTNLDVDVSTFDVSSLTDATSMMSASDFSDANYDLLLNSTTGWPSQTLNSAVPFHAGTAQYCAGAVGHNILEQAPNLWVLTDGGFTCPSLAMNLSENSQYLSLIT